MPQRVPCLFCQVGTATEVSSQRAQKTAFTGACQAATLALDLTLRTTSNKCLLLVDVLPVGFYSGPGTKIPPMNPSRHLGWMQSFPGPGGSDALAKHYHLQ